MTPTTQSVVVPVDLVRFLLGEGSFDGRDFGDDPLRAGDQRAPYWWRTPLRQSLAAPAPSSLAGGEVDEAIRTAWGGAMTVACNIAIDEQNRTNDDDGPSDVLNAQGEIIRRLKAVLEIDAPYLAEVKAVLSPEAAEREGVDGLVDRFAVALKEKLCAAEAKYGHGDAWMRDDWRDDLIENLWRHVQKGDPRDVAAYCAFAWHHDWSLSLGDPVGPIIFTDGPRHEAPAEGALGEAIKHLTEMSELEAVYGQLARNLRIVLSALRARSSAPEAREGEAVAWRMALSDIDGHFTYSNVGDDGWQPLYTHPAAPSADKLRISTSALELIADGLPDARAVHRFGEARSIARQALAALKAEVAK